MKNQGLEGSTQRSSFPFFKGSLEVGPIPVIYLPILAQPGKPASGSRLFSYRLPYLQCTGPHFNTC